MRWPVIPFDSSAFTGRVDRARLDGIPSDQLTGWTFPPLFDTGGLIVIRMTRDPATWRRRNSVGLAPGVALLTDPPQPC